VFPERVLLNNAESSPVVGEEKLTARRQSCSSDFCSEINLDPSVIKSHCLFWLLHKYILPTYKITPAMSNSLK
jgi:hypothetical protein